MDEAPRQDREAVEGQDNGEQRSPEEIQRDIDRTRDELGDTVAAMAQKADVKAQAKGKVTEVKQSVQDKKDELTGKAREATPESASAGAHQAASTAKENPVPLAVGGAFAAGLVLGWLVGRR